MIVTEDRYTLQQLVTAARDAGFDPTERLVKDWVSLGLLDHARRRGRGRGKGREGTWPESQEKLFLLLLGKRAEVKRIATLCNVPVAMWLLWGDDYVPLRQAKLALETWAGAYDRVPWRKARWTANQLVAQFAHPEGKLNDRRKLITAVAESGFGKPFSREEILPLLRRVFDPHGSRRPVGPPWLNATPESFVFLVEARVRAITALRESQLEEQAFEWARTAYRESRTEYARLEPTLAADAEASEWFLHRSAAGIVLPTTIDEMVNDACIDLLTLLGIHQQRTTTDGDTED